MANTAVVLSLVCTVLVTSIVIRREFFPQVAAAAKPVTIDSREWAAISTGGLRIGPASATLIVVEFVDFECPACAAFYRTLKRFQSAHADEVAVVLQHYPLQMHPNALRLAKTVECAAHSGRLEAIQDSIFSRQAALVGWEPVRLAMMVGIDDTVDFARCVADSLRTRGVTEGRAAARRLNITGTPTIIANGRQYQQLVDSTVLADAFKDAKKQ